MKSRIYAPFLFLAAFILLVGLACSVDLFGNDGSGAPASSDAPASSEAASSSEEEVVSSEEEEVSSEEEASSEEPAAEAPAFYREEFDGDLSNYTYFEFHGRDDEVTLDSDGNDLVFDLQKENQWVYVTYDPYIYTDVVLEVSADNRGRNNNNVSIICRYSDEGWYEFNIANNGLYWILAYSTVDKSYSTIINGGSNAIKQGKDINIYRASCIGEELKLTINGVEVKKIKDVKYKLRDGLVGFGVSSFDVLPILVEVDYFDISQP